MMNSILIKDIYHKVSKEKLHIVNYIDKKLINEVNLCFIFLFLTKGLSRNKARQEKVNRAEHKNTSWMMDLQQ